MLFAAFADGQLTPYGRKDLRAHITSRTHVKRTFILFQLTFIFPGKTIRTQISQHAGDIKWRKLDGAIAWLLMPGQVDAAVKKYVPAQAHQWETEGAEKGDKVHSLLTVISSFCHSKLALPELINGQC